MISHSAAPPVARQKQGRCEAWRDSFPRDAFRGALLGLRVGELVSEVPALLSQPIGDDHLQPLPQEPGYWSGAVATAKWLVEGGDERKKDIWQLYENSTSTFGNEVAASAVPIGLALFRSPGEACSKARELANETHLHPIGLDGAGVMAAAIAEALMPRDVDRWKPQQFIKEVRKHAQTRRFRDLLRQISSVPELSRKTVVTLLGTTVEAHRSIPTALYLFARHGGSFVATFGAGLELEADRSIVSLACALSGAHLGERCFPQSLVSLADPDQEIRRVADALYERICADGSTSNTNR